MYVISSRGLAARSHATTPFSDRAHSTIPKKNKRLLAVYIAYRIQDKNDNKAEATDQVFFLLIFLADWNFHRSRVYADTSVHGPLPLIQVLKLEQSN